MNKIIHTIGAIAKEELLTSLEHNILPDTLVLENSEPFPGYHGMHPPTDSSPLYVFFIPKERLSIERVIRVSHNIRKIFTMPFDACTGRICIETTTINCIRIKELPEYSLISELQRCFLDEGISFLRKKKIHHTGIIQLRKHLTLQEIEKGIFRDLEDADMHYIEIPRQLKWKVFKVIDRNVKNNVENSNYDAALGAVYLRDVIDVVRVYAENWSIDQFRALKDRYAYEIRRFE